MRCIEHAPRTGEIGNVGGGLAGEDRIAGEAAFLAALDLAVPVGALDQTHENPPAGFGAQRLQPVEHGRRSEEHTSELQSLMRISYAVLCLKNNTKMKRTTYNTLTTRYTCMYIT